MEKISGGEGFSSIGKEKTDRSMANGEKSDPEYFFWGKKNAGVFDFYLFTLFSL